MINFNFKGVFLDLLKKKKDIKFAVDATLGNGHDTKVILENTNAKVFSFDIQTLAIENSKRLLRKFENDRYQLIHDSHANVKNYVHEKVDLVVFNTGYLPNSDKKITTDKFSLKLALDSSLELLNSGGIIFFVQYIGHPGSFSESEFTDSYFKKLDQKKFRVIKYEFYNQINYPPIVYLMEKI